MQNKQADLAGPGISTYEEVAKILPDDYTPSVSDGYLRTAHLGETSVTIWPKELKDICAPRNIHVLE